jgi:hypothetical protein
MLGITLISWRAAALLPEALPVVVDIVGLSKDGGYSTPAVRVISVKFGDKVDTGALGQYNFF